MITASCNANKFLLADFTQMQSQLYLLEIFFSLHNNRFTPCVFFRADYPCSMMTAPTFARGAPWSPALGSTPPLKSVRWFIHRSKSALITLAQHQNWSIGARRQLFEESRQLVHWQFLEIRVPTKPSRTLSGRHTAETCYWNIHSTLHKTNLSLPRP